jgi:transposase InsO family protein
MDFTHDSMVNGRRFRTLNLMDGYTREALAIEVDTSLPGGRVVRVLERLKQERGMATRIVVDNGPEFLSRAVDQWAYENGLRQYFLRRTDLSGYTQSDLDKVALLLNQRPRKTLGFQTPTSKLQASVASTH